VQLLQYSLSRETLTAHGERKIEKHYVVFGLRFSQCFGSSVSNVRMQVEFRDSSLNALNHCLGKTIIILNY